ncbi:MAG: L,D-transpeptidase family protein [Sphingorhabdus sp.]
MTKKSIIAKSSYYAGIAAAVMLLSSAPVFAQDGGEAQPENLLPDVVQDGDTKPTAENTPQPAPEAVPSWKVEYAANLLAAINAIGSEGLKPADYQPQKLVSAITGGEGAALDAEAERALTWLIEDMRDGRTPMKSRVQWFVVDPDSDVMPTEMLLKKAMETGDVAGILKSLEPTHTDYAALRAELTKTPENSPVRRKKIAANMDRWRWLKRDLGKDYLRTNVPEYMLRFVVNNQQISTYRTIVGKPGRTATPQLAENVRGIIFNPTWTVPQSIVKGEGLGTRVLGNPAWARTKGYKATKSASGRITVVQQPGPRNSLGYMKLDMPNPHAIFLHDTPSRRLFKNANRALSHGCIRTERAAELAMTIALVQGDVPVQRSVAIMKSLKYTRVPVKRKLPVYITYFTMATDVNGKMANFRDIYGRDKPVLKALAGQRPVRAGKMKSDEKVVAIEAPGA